MYGLDRYIDSDVSDAHFRGLVNLTGLSRLKYNVSCQFVTIDITAAQRGPFNALSLLLRQCHFPDTELYRQIIYPEYIPYNKAYK